jgi:hydroxyethylthiazole kinase-like uncharacterized protein yjeF
MDGISVAEMRVAEINSEFLGVPTIRLMEAAGASVASEIRKRVAPGARVAVLAGSGGKAGDGFVAARHLDSMGYQVTVYLVSNSVRNPDAAKNFEVLKSSTGAEVKQFDGRISNDFDVVVDALLGTGVKGAPRGKYVDAIDAINSSQAKLKVSIDLPSGVMPDTGEVPGTAVKADLTVTMQAPKKGLLVEPARKYVGELVVANIGIPRAAFTRVGPGDVRIWYVPKPATAKKGDGGRVLVVAGSAEYVGAPWLTSIGAWSAGADLVFLLAPEDVVNKRFSPEIIAHSLEGERLVPKHVETVEKYVERADVVAIGQGLGMDPETFEAVDRLGRYAVAQGKYLVIDADALKALSNKGIDLGNRAIMTPHLGEASRLLGHPLENTRESRIEAAKEIARRFNAVVLLKGFVDVVAEPGGDFRVREGIGSSDMSAGGTGDILTGVAAEILARSGNPFGAARAASFVMAVAGVLSYYERGRSTPLNLVEYIPSIIRDPVATATKALQYMRS